MAEPSPLLTSYSVLQLLTKKVRITPPCIDLRLFTALTITMTFFSLLITLFTLTHARTISLPPAVQVEGVAHAAGTNFFVSDIRSGAIFLVDIDSGLVTTAIPTAPNRTALGLYVSRGRLFVARGGDTGFGSGPGPSHPLLQVYDIATGSALASCPLDAGAVVNDVVADHDFAYYTDSLLGIVYKLRLATLGACQIEKIRLPQPFFKLTDIRATDIRANGIIKYKQGLIVANFFLSTLFFIDLLNGNKGQQMFPTGSLTGADGLEIDRRKGGSLLYVVQPVDNLVSVWKLSIDDDRRVSAGFVQNITSPEFEAPTTAALSGRKLVVANSGFNEVSPLDPIPKNFRTSVSVVRV